jgi:hypothetical protein
MALLQERGRLKNLFCLSTKGPNQIFALFNGKIYGQRSSPIKPKNHPQRAFRGDGYGAKTV